MSQLDRTIWRGIEIARPAEWELSVASPPDSKKGRCAFSDRYFLLLIGHATVLHIGVVPIGPPALANPGPFYNTGGRAIGCVATAVEVMEATGTVGDFVVVLIGVHNPGHGQALEIVLTDDAFSLFSGLAKGRHENGH